MKRGGPQSRGGLVQEGGKYGKGKSDPSSELGERKQRHKGPEVGLWLVGYPAWPRGTRGQGDKQEEDRNSSEGVQAFGRLWSDFDFTPRSRNIPVFQDRIQFQDLTRRLGVWEVSWTQYHVLIVSHL